MKTNFDNKLFQLSHETILKLSENDNGSIGNVIRGLHKQCFGITSETNSCKDVNFFYINFCKEVPGLLFKLELKENNYYEYLLSFSVYVTKYYDLIDPINVYNTFINYSRSFLEQHGYFTISTTEFKKLPYDGELISPFEIEVIKDFEKEDFYRFWLNSSELGNLEIGINHLYIMLNKATGYFKLGRSINPQYRERTLQSQEPDIVLLKTWQCDKDVERELHRIFQAKKVRGEWFKLDFEDLNNIDKIVNEVIGKHSR